MLIAYLMYYEKKAHYKRLYQNARQSYLDEHGEHVIHRNRVKYYLYKLNFKSRSQHV